MHTAYDTREESLTDSLKYHINAYLASQPRTQRIYSDTELSSDYAMQELGNCLYW